MRTIVEYFGSQPGHRCGYCKSTDGNLSHGLWAHSLTPLDYMDMLDRGWRRSGCYCYKPTMKETCCPQYTIRCDAPNFKLTRSQKRVISIVNGFLLKDERPKNKNVDSKQSINSGKRNSIKRSKICPETNAPQTSQCAANVQKDRSGKAKEKRKSRALQRWRDKNLDPEVQMELKRAKAKNKPKLLEERLQLPQGSQPKHELKIVLSCRGLENWERYERTGHKIFKKYQMAIHGDGEEDCDWCSFKNFLIDHPFEEPSGENDDLPEYGAFHQQYLLDGKIIAVGVIDILPRCVSSKYLFYDPEYSFLSLGVYSALTEIALTRRLHEKCENLRWYYMGYYIHSCPKMTYKGRYKPAQLLCPETYTWHPIEMCQRKLDMRKYSRFNEDEQAVDPNTPSTPSNALVLHKRTAMPFDVYREVKPDSDDVHEVQEYVKLIGGDVAGRVLLFRS